MVFTGNANPELAKLVVERLDLSLGEATVGKFSDGEITVEINENVRGKDVFILQPTCAPTNDNLMEMLLMADGLRRASASRITAVVPYFGYARQDRRPRSARVPISARAVADMMSGSGIDRVLTVDLHADQIQGFFDIPVDHLWARPALQEALMDRVNLQNLVICSPDVGGVKLARAWAKALNVPLTIVDKRRTSGDSVVMEHVIGEVEGKEVLLTDDMISTAGTVTEAARILKEKGAERVFIAASHAVLCGPAVERLQNCPVEEVLVSNTIALRGELPDNLKVVSVAPLLARAVTRIHREESVSALFESAPIE
jgi:ribose-phosphate pyrophosphokinase